VWFVARWERNGLTLFFSNLEAHMESPDHVENSWLTPQACHVVVQMSAPHQ
jgi:hypothetical protein